jgi:hypothetical protein
MKKKAFPALSPLFVALANTPPQYVAMNKKLTPVISTGMDSERGLTPSNRIENV